MVVTQTYTNNQINENILTHSAAELRALTSDQLVAELKNVERDLRALKAVFVKHPELKHAPHLKKYNNALNGEKRRIGKVLDERARAKLQEWATFPLGESAAAGQMRRHDGND